MHKDNNSAKGERTGGTDNGPLLVRLRLGIAALSIVVGLSSSVFDFDFKYLRADSNTVK